MRHNKPHKETAVARILANEAPLLELAREYSVSTNTLRAWVRESKLSSQSNWYDTPAGLQAVIAALPLALLLVDQLGAILLANAAAESVFARSLPQGTPLCQLNLHWLDAAGKQPALADDLLRTLLTGGTGEEVVRARVGIDPPNGGVRWLDTLMRTIRLPNEPTVAALLVFA